MRLQARLRLRQPRFRPLRRPNGRLVAALHMVSPAPAPERCPAILRAAVWQRFLCENDHIVLYIILYRTILRCSHATNKQAGSLDRGTFAMRQDSLHEKHHGVFLH